MQPRNSQLIWLFIIALLTVLVNNCLSLLLNELSDRYKWKDVIPNYVIWLLAFMMSVLFAYLSWLIQNNSNSGTQRPINRVTPQLLKDSRGKFLRVLKGDIEERLEKLLYNNTVFIPLNIEQLGNQSPLPQAVNQNKQVNPLLTVIKPFLSWISNGQNTPLPPETKIVDIFSQEEGKLLILGTPGSGKTTLLLQLAKELIATAEVDENKPIPVVFELTNWQKKQKITDWLVEQLKYQYSISEDIAKEWLNTNQILPFFDGLDELKEDQVECIHAINNFINQEPQPLHLVVCCRSQEYDSGNTLLRLNAVCVQPLNQSQIEVYFSLANRSYLWNGIKSNPDLLELAQSPLLLKFMVEAYKQAPARKLQNFSSPEACCQSYLDDLFDAYIKVKLDETQPSKLYKVGKEPSKENTKFWLVWLAKKLKDNKQTEFLIEKMQPHLLDNFLSKFLYGLIIGLITGLILGLITWLIFGLIFGLIIGLILGLITGLDDKSIEPQEAFQISWLKIKDNWKKIIELLIFWLIIGLITGLIFGLITGIIISNLISGLIIGLIVGLIMGLINGLEADIKNRTIPNQGIWKSAKNGLIIAMITFPILTMTNIQIRLIRGIRFEAIEILIIGLVLGLALGFNFGGLSVIQHCILRFILWRNGSIPWNYANFLGYAAERGFIIQVGGRYRFKHDLLREHFAKL
ncbi:MAG: NACHT domain-containing protein [Nostoc sp. DedVER02]|uniref:NACHT domain-containing protein n=1 Tax=unclassified Nostoc TaxID=2593658 RepID=UPI002AD356D2|nr:MULTISPECIES: NACHT domain-containing protein [unclassified Nostoc]MDZ7985942.1 NACHT domain-containing protein [Nostoc sp. DedVER02]MDZ8111499.1 NACHT domain-containing protein [Nostoc sp. DedVER01b]